MKNQKEMPPSLSCPNDGTAYAYPFKLLLPLRDQMSPDS
jgi:hypothetical protein